MGFNFSTLWARVENVVARYRQLGGPQTLDNIVSLRVAPTATGPDAEQETFRAIDDNEVGATPARLLGVVARLQGYDDNEFNALRTQSAAVAGDTDNARGVLVVAQKTAWTVVANPVAGIQAAAGKAPPGLGACHVITGLIASLDDDGTGVLPDRIELLDGDSVAYLVTHMGLPAGSGEPCARFQVTGLHIVLPPNQQAVWRFAGAPPGTARQSVTMIGYTTSA